MCLAFLSIASGGFAADSYWTNTSGNFTNTVNWNPNTVPGAADNANFTSSASYTVTFSSGATNANAYFNDGNGTVTLTNIAGTTWWVSNSFVVGQLTGSTSAVTQTSGTIAVTNSSGTGTLIVGDLGKGTFNLNGGTVYADNFVSTNGANSSFVFNGGTLDTTHFYFTNSGPSANSLLRGGTLITRGDSTITSGGDLQIAGNTASLFTWNILGGTNRLVQSGGWLTLSDGSGQVIINVSGSGTVFTNSGSGNVLLGSNGGRNNQVNVSNGASAYFASGVQVGYNTTGSTNNSLLVTGNGSRLSIGGTLTVGHVGSGNSLTVEAGATNVTGQLNIGDNALSFSNRVLVTGAGALMTNSGAIFVGLGGYNNNLTVSNGGTAITSGGYIVLGNSTSSSNNTVLVTGAGSFLSGQRVRVGLNSSGTPGTPSGNNNTLTVLDGGTVETTEIGVNGGNFVTNSGGIFQFTTATPAIYTTNGATKANIVVTNGTISFRNVAAADVFGNVTGSGLTNITYQGNNTFRLNASSNAASAQNYTFNTGSGATNYVGLEFAGTGSLWRSTHLTIGTNGTLLASNAVASVNAAFTNFGVTRVVNSTLTFGTNIVIRGAGQMILTNVGRVVSFTTILGAAVGDSGGQVLVTGLGSVLSNTSTFNIGVSSGNHQLIITNGGLAYNTSSSIGTTDERGASNTVVVAGSGSIWTNTSTLTVGSAGGFNKMTISNSGQVFNTTGTIGNGIGGSNNTVIVTDTGSVWRSSSTLTVGDSGRANQLLITNGGHVFNTIGTIGNIGNSNAVTVTGPGSVWSNSSTLDVGDAGSANRLTIADGGLVVNSQGRIGNSVGGSNIVLVTGIGSVWSNTSFVYVGLDGSFNQLVVTNGGVVHSSTGNIGLNDAATNNAAVVAGSGSTWRMSGDLGLSSSGGYGNQLTIANSGTVINAIGTIGSGFTGMSNSVLVTGSGSLWSNTSQLRVGFSGIFNQLVIEKAGQVQNTTATIGGNSSGSTGNVVVVRDTGSVWTSTGDMTIGANGASFNNLTISNGALVSASRTFIGSGAGATSNSVLVTGNGSILTNAGGTASPFTIGNAAGASFNTLVVSNGGKVYGNTSVSATEAIGSSSGANSNSVLVTDANSLLQVSVGLSVGGSGTGNSLTITNGGQVLMTVGSGNGLFVGNNGTNTVVTVTGSGSMLSNAFNTFVGNSAGGINNSLVIANSGLVVNATATIGNVAGASSNSALVTGAGSVWSNISTLTVGGGGSFNSLTVTNQGVVYSTTATIGTSAGANSNTVTIADSGSQWNMAGSTLTVGDAGSYNQLVISNGAQVVANIGSIGGTSGGGSNIVIVTGPGSVWSNLSNSSSTLRVGSRSSGNQLIVTNGGSVVSLGDVNIGNLTNNAGGASQGSVVITGPDSILVASASGVAVNVGSNNLAASRGQGSVLITDGGTLEANILRAGFNGSGTISNIGGVYQFTSGTPTITPNTANNIAISNGVVSYRNVADANVLNAQVSNISFTGNNTFRLNSSSNSGTVNQNYTFDSNGNPTNYVKLEMVNGNTLWRGARLGVGTNGTFLASNTVGTVNAALTNFGVMTVVNSKMTFNSNVVIHGSYTSDPSTNTFFGDLSITNGGVLVGGLGDLFDFKQNFLITTTNSQAFDLSVSQVLFSGGNGHTNAVVGRDFGGGTDAVKGFAATNYSYGRLTIASTGDVVCVDCLAPAASNALYVTWLDLSGLTNDIANVSNMVTSVLHAPAGMTIYYANYDLNNSYLNNQTYQLVDCDLLSPGGFLMPAIPEPSTLGLALMAASAYLFRRTRRQTS